MQRSDRNLKNVTCVFHSKSIDMQITRPPRTTIPARRSMMSRRFRDHIGPDSYTCLRSQRVREFPYAVPYLYKAYLRTFKNCSQSNKTICTSCLCLQKKGRSGQRSVWNGGTRKPRLWLWPPVPAGNVLTLWIESSGFPLPNRNVAGIHVGVVGSSRTIKIGKFFVGRFR